MKDYDDLWRISKNKLGIDSDKLRTILEEKSIKPSLDKDWIGELLREQWKAHWLDYKDLPRDLEKLFDEVNL